ncbi:Putative nickel-responsive regulator [Aquisphaera giovannonii]|uniref:Putative nickel-responsive regulator n=1 Tax=Aquisphaera giovannonii TaxID=406548 RepID=A0A5B9VZ33_9BACT|nr:nickel-responsive transcriptional regulator NikR [Aquisphaera giovannonii]QEH33227.1 Putative nickel-responsive regulator [Aquisphaera giovannonii]
MKDPLVRFSVAIGGELLRRFDRYREEHRYPNRSEAVRGLMTAALVEDVVERDESEAMGVVTLVYDHHAGRIAERLTELQHGHVERVVTTTHVHLDERRCLEVILLRGQAKVVRQLADDLIGVKGVETGRLVLTAATPVVGNGVQSHHHDHGHGHGHRHEHDHPHTHEGPDAKAARRPGKRRPG